MQLPDLLGDPVFIACLTGFLLIWVAYQSFGRRIVTYAFSDETLDLRAFGLSLVRIKYSDIVYAIRCPTHELSVRGPSTLRFLSHSGDYLLIRTRRFVKWEKVIISPDDPENFIAKISLKKAEGSEPDVPERPVREGEVKAFTSKDGKTCVEIVRRPDGLFCCYEDGLRFDEDDLFYYWSPTRNPVPGIYGTLEDAERDIRSVPKYGELVLSYKPDATIEVSFKTALEGGRSGPVIIEKSLYRCALRVGNELFDCRALLTDTILQLGETYELPIKFLSPTLVMPLLTVGKEISLWEGKAIAEGRVLSLSAREGGHPAPGGPRGY